MLDTYKIFPYIDSIQDTYGEPISRVTGLIRNPKEIIRTVEFYSDNEYLSGNLDELGREKPFYNVGNYRVTVAKTATDLDVKDIKYEPDSLKFSIQAMIINRMLYQKLKDINFSMTLNDMGYTRPKYGHLMVKKTKVNGKLKIDIVDWSNVEFNPKNVKGGAVIEHFWLQPSELADMADAWDIEDFMKAHNKQNKNKPVDCEVIEVSGEFPESMYPENEDNKSYVDSGKYARMCFYIGVVNNKKYMLYYEYEKDGKYKDLAWEKRGDGFGRGVVEDGFQAQVWTNDTMISLRNAMDISTKIVGITDSQKISGNSITGVDNGHIWQLEPGRMLDFKALGSINIPQFQTALDLWDSQYNKVASTFDANTGEAPTAGTPYSQTALLNQVANSPFEFRREEYGIFVNEILNDWIYPEVMKDCVKSDWIMAEFDNEELDLIDESIANFTANNMIHEKNLNGSPTDPIATPEFQAEITNNVKNQLKKFGKKREIKFPKGYLDVKGRLTANITGELKNKGALLASLDGLFKTVVSTFNPNTGTYAALQDPILSKMFGQIVEMSGVPFSAGQLRSATGTAPVAQPSTAQAPVAPITA